MESDQFELETTTEPRQEILEVQYPIFYQMENTPVGWLQHLALEKGDWQFTATHVTQDLYKLTHPTGLNLKLNSKKEKEQIKAPIR